MKVRELITYIAKSALLFTVALLAGIGAFAAFFSWTSSTYAPANSSDLAAWIQAVGSIGAILGAFWVANRQANEQRNQIREQRLLLDRQICGAIEVAYSVANAIREKADGTSLTMFLEVWNYYLASHTETIAAQCKTLPLYVLGSPDRIDPAARIVAVLIDSRSLVLELVQSESGVRPLEFARMCTQIRMHAKILDSSISRFRQMNEKFGPR